MMTIVKSPARQLREHFAKQGFGPVSSTRPRYGNAADVLGWSGIRTGQRVRRKDDPRHEGRLEGWSEKQEAKVRWDWPLSGGLMEYEIPLAELEPVK